MNATRRNGFTLIELMIVVAIIAIILAVAIPNLLRSRAHANEASAVYNLRAIVSAQSAFHAAQNAYTPDFADLTSATPPFLSGEWSSTRNGYDYVLGGTADNFTVNANAQAYGVTGMRGFFSDSSGVIRHERLADADVTSNPLDQAAL